MQATETGQRATTRKWKPLRDLFLALTALALLLIAGCGAGAERPSTPPPATLAGPPPPGLPALPAPSQIGRHTSGGPENTANGDEFDAMTAHNLAAGSNQDGLLTPNWTPQAPTSLAYGLYSIVPGPGFAPLLHLAWYDPVPPAGTCWVGVGNFATDSWAWHPWTKGQDIALDLGGVNVGSLGQTVVAVVLTGTTPYDLGRVRIGANTHPDMFAALTHASHGAPVTLNVDAHYCSDDGVISKYEFDFDGDGVYDQSGSASQAQFNATVDGSYACIVRCTDDEGAQWTATYDWDTGYADVWRGGTTFDATSFAAIRTAPDGGFYVGGQVKPDGSSYSHALIMKCNADASIAWAKLLSSAKGDRTESLAIAPDGGVYVAGNFNDDGLSNSDAFLAHYLPNGTLDWQRRWGGGKAPMDAWVAADNTNNCVYLATSLSTPANSYDAALLRFSNTGAWSWTRTWGAADDEEGRGVAVDESGNVYLSICDHNSSAFAGLVKFNAAGVQQGKQLYQRASFDIDPQGLTRDPASGTLAIQGGMANGPLGGPFLLLLNPDLTFHGELAITENNGSDEHFYDSCFAPDGSVWLAGQGPSCNLVLHAGGDGSSLGVWNSSSGSTYAAVHGVDLAPEGGLRLAGFSPGLNGAWNNSANLPAVFTVFGFLGATDSAANNTAPLIATATSADVQQVAGQGDGGVYFKFYPPLP